MKPSLPLTLTASTLACGIAFSGLGPSAPAIAQIVDQNGVENLLAGPFARTATYPVYENVPDGADPADETVSEISTVSADGNTMIYTDAAGKRIGFIDISDPAAPKGDGTVDLAELGHADDQPTSVAVTGDYVLVVIDETGGDFSNPQGRIDVLRLSDRERVASIDLEGQPDSIAISKDGAYAAIAMENQRDEEAGDGGLPQMPGGLVQTISLSGDATGWKAVPIRFTDDDGNPLPIVEEAGLDTPEDMEPEYVSFNSKGQLAVTLQENNGVAIIDVVKPELTGVFSAGTVDLEGIDNAKDGVIDPTGSESDVVREPDAIAWIDDEHVATANEGDWKGGSRGWTVFDVNGTVVWDSRNSIEELANRYGLHNENRAGKKGPEIEGIATAAMNGTRYAFVGSERSNVVAVYRVDDPANPEFVQNLFTTNGPEGILPIPERNLLVVSSETDESDKGVRSAVSLFQLDGKQPEVPQPSIVSDEADGHYIGWTALGSLTGDEKDAATLYAASDAALGQGMIYTIDASQTPALITKARAVTRDGEPAEGLDIEGLASRDDGGFWLASEGKTGEGNSLIRTNADLGIEEEVPLPEDVAQHIGKWGLEGVDTYANEAGEEILCFAIQRPLWDDPSADDLTAMEGENTTRIGRYNTATKEFEWFSYELDSTDAKGDWMGLSELTVVDEDTLAVIERDKLNGPDAEVKRIMKVELGQDSAQAGGAAAESTQSTAAGTDQADGVTPVTKSTAIDVLPYLRATNGWTQEKLEGFTIAADGQMYAVTDNDGLDDATGETVFLRLGDVEDVFAAAEPTEDPTDESSAGPTDETSADPTQEAEPMQSDSATDAAQTGRQSEEGDVQGSADDQSDSAESEAPAGPGPLPRTGVSIGIGLAVAAALLGAGVTAVRIARRGL